MNKISKVEIVCELILTLILLYIFRFNVYWRKYLLAYFVVQFMSGRYKGNSILIWDEINLLIKSHILYFIFCFIIAPHSMYTFYYVLKLILMTICSFILVIACTRTVRIHLRDRYKNRILVFGIGENAREVERVINGNRFSMMEVEAFVNCNESEKISHKQDSLVNESRIISIL